MFVHDVHDYELFDAYIASLLELCLSDRVFSNFYVLSYFVVINTPSKRHNGLGSRAGRQVGKLISNRLGYLGLCWDSCCTQH